MTKFDFVIQCVCFYLSPPSESKCALIASSYCQYRPSGSLECLLASAISFEIEIDLCRVNLPLLKATICYLFRSSFESSECLVFFEGLSRLKSSHCAWASASKLRSWFSGGVFLSGHEGFCFK